MVRRRVRCIGRTLHAEADDSIVWPPGGDGAAHVDGGLRADLSGAVLEGVATPVEKSAYAV